MAKPPKAPCPPKPTKATPQFLPVMCVPCTRCACCPLNPIFSQLSSSSPLRTGTAVSGHCLQSIGMCNGCRLFSGKVDHLKTVMPGLPKLELAFTNMLFLKRHMAQLKQILATNECLVRCACRGWVGGGGHVPGGEGGKCEGKGQGMFREAVGSG